MKLIFATAAVVLAASGVPAAQVNGPDKPQSSPAETMDRLPPERMEQLVARPMSKFRKFGLVAAQKDFDALLAHAAKTHGNRSAEAADLLTSFGVELYLESGGGDGRVAKASLDYLKRAIPAYRAAFGPRHPEVALALNSYADALVQVNGDAARAEAKTALEEAYSIRLATLGPDNAETQETADKLAQLNDSSRSFSAERDVANALASAAAAAGPEESPTTGVTETLTGADIATPGLWKPTVYYDPLLDDFIADAKQLDEADAPSRERIAAKYRLSVPALNAIVSFAREMDKDGYSDRRRPELRKNALHLLDVSNRAPIALMYAAGALSEFGDNGCSTEDANQLMSGSHDLGQDLWAVASTCTSSAVLADAIDKHSAALPALLYLSLGWTNGDHAHELAAADMLLRPEFLAQVDEQHRDAVAADVASYKLSKLLSLGLVPEALAFGDSLPPDLRAQALRGRSSGFRTTIAGFPVKSSSQSQSPAIEYAAALALAGRNAQARSVLDAIAPEPKLRSARACLDAASTEDCGVGDSFRGQLPLGALIVDQLLDDPTGDPYVLLEQAATGSNLDGGAIDEVLCRLLSQPSERKECQDLQHSDAENRAPDQYDNDSDRPLWAAIANAGGQSFRTAQAAYAGKLAALGVSKAAERSWSRVTVDPSPVPFQELPIPSDALAKHPLPALGSKALAPLPAGYTMIRAERSGRRVAAISLSQRFDPDGEVTAGGYWLHLSEDGGKSWQPPLYTGLAEHFPYVVPASSRLRMIAGDRIHLEVQEALIDTASIMYPPVGTKVRRKRSGIYLDIPIADLRKDSDGDGLSDIAARHLLLDQAGTAIAPFVVGSDRNCSKPLGMETLARLEILKQLFQVDARALIEPVGAKGIRFGGWRRSEPTSKPPIFLRGKPDDYRCVSIDRMMIVYPDRDRDELRKFSPDFQLLELPDITWNRDHTRGFVRWSSGWAGGTYRLVREGGGWKIEPVSQWIS